MGIMMPSLDAFPLEKKAEALYPGEDAYTKKRGLTPLQLGHCLDLGAFSGRQWFLSTKWSPSETPALGGREL